MYVPFDLTAIMINAGHWKSGLSNAPRLCLLIAMVVCVNIALEKYIHSFQKCLQVAKVVALFALLWHSVTGLLGAGDTHNRATRGFETWRNPGPMREYVFRGHIRRFWGLI